MADASDIRAQIDAGVGPLVYEDQTWDAVDLDDVEFEHAIRFVRCRFGSLMARRARFHSLDFVDCELRDQIDLSNAILEFDLSFGARRRHDAPRFEELRGRVRSAPPIASGAQPPYEQVLAVAASRLESPADPHAAAIARAWSRVRDDVPPVGANDLEIEPQESIERAIRAAQVALETSMGIRREAPHMAPIPIALNQIDPPWLQPDLERRIVERVPQNDAHRALRVLAVAVGSADPDLPVGIPGDLQDELRADRDRSIGALARSMHATRPSRMPGIDASGATINGNVRIDADVDLDLSHASVQGAIVLDSIRGAVTLVGTSGRELECLGPVATIDATGAQLSGTVRIIGSVATDVRFERASCGADMWLVGDFGASIRALRLSVTGELLMTGWFEGTPWLSWVTAAKLTCAGWFESGLEARYAHVESFFVKETPGHPERAATEARATFLPNHDGLSINATAFRCASDLSLGGGQFYGQVVLDRAHVGGALLVRRHNLGLPGPAFHARANSMAAARGGVSLRDAVIESQLSIYPARFERGCELDLEGCSVRKLDDAWEGVNVGVTIPEPWAFSSDEERTSSTFFLPEPPPKLAMFSYDDIAGIPPDRVTRAIWIKARMSRWLAGGTSRTHAESSTRTYMPAQFARFSQVLDARGFPDDARIARYEMSKARHRALHGAERGWSFILDKMVGYGYKPLRAATWAVGSVALGVAVFYLARSGVVLADGGAHDLSQYSSVAMSVDAFLPAISFGHEGKYVADTTNLTGWIVQGWYWLEAAIGWLLVLSIAYSVTHDIQSS